MQSGKLIYYEKDQIGNTNIYAVIFKLAVFVMPGWQIIAKQIKVLVFFVL